MNKIIYIISAVCIFIIFKAYASTFENIYTIKDIQGGWWPSCEGSTVEFLISGDKYIGDFYGRHPLSLNNNTLTFENGFVEGHNVNVSFKPREFFILNVSKEHMVLQSTTDEGAKREWKLFSCVSEHSDSLIKNKKTTK